MGKEVNYASALESRFRPRKGRGGAKYSGIGQNATTEICKGPGRKEKKRGGDLSREGVHKSGTVRKRSVAIAATEIRLGKLNLTSHWGGAQR